MANNVCLPVQLEAFILNGPVVDNGPTLIAPITQPNYVSLRLQNSVIQHDLLPNIDLSNAKPAIGNPRVSRIYSTPFTFLDTDDPAPGPTSISLNKARFGVYLHWSIPRGYRTGTAASQTPADPRNPQDQQATQKAAQPTFRQVPDRWIVVRILRDYTPKTANVDTVTAWVVESNRLRNLSELDPNTDLQTEVSPFVAYQNQDATTNTALLDNQAEKYIGYRTSLKGWGENAKASRVPLTTMNSTNPLFADYAIHNPNVFSTHDNFSHGDGTQFLQTATCDYVVVGWHSSVANPTDPSPPATDPLRKISSSDPTLDPSLLGRLKAIFCQVPDGASPSSTDAARLVCHSTIYGIKYDAGVRPATPADTYANLLTGNGDIDMEPVSIGTTPLDSILSFLEAHKDPADNAFEENLLNDKGSVTASTLRSMTELLYATQDTYDERIKAADLVYHHNFSQSGSGFVWRYDKKKRTGDDSTGTVVSSNSPPATPSAAEAATIAQLNNMQRLLDVAQSKLRLIQWSLFSEFFKYCSDPVNSTQIDIYSTRVQALSPEGHALQNQVQTLTQSITTLSQTIQVKRFSAEPFFSRNDPTLCLAGLDSGWPAEYLSNTPTRTSSKLIGPTDPKQAAAAKAALDLVSAMPIAQDLRDTIGRIVSEASGGFPTSPLLGHTKWSGQQPFSPQFIEWEGVYYHVGPFKDQWDLGVDFTGSSESNQEQLRYINPTTLANSTQKWLQDSRRLSGRILVLPQPSFALQAVVKQVLATAPDKDLPDNLTDPDPDKEKAKKDAFAAAAGKLRFISGQLTGLTDALLTLATGSHVKPNLRQAGQLVIPMKAATDVGKHIQLSDLDFSLMDAETAKTPYGTLTDFTGAPGPFKGVQHGQFAITKLTIVDKFGQAVCCPPTERTPYTPSGPPKFVNPCLADQLLPTVLDGGKLNVVYGPSQVKPDLPTKSGYPMSPFIQLTPSINQDARINASFVQRDEDSKGNFSKWRPSTPWENPIIGWIVVNYANSALQFFTTEGIFYTSVRFGGPTGVIKSHDWLPFSQPPTPSSTVAVSDQLRALVAVLIDTSNPATKGQYLLSLWKTIEVAIQNMPFAPSAYSGTANAIVGKPLALVNVGWSLELAQPPLWAQHTLPPPPVLAPRTVDPLRTDAINAMKEYKFKVKLGDVSFNPLQDPPEARTHAQANRKQRDRTFDGLVAYWDTQSGTTDFKDGFFCFAAPTSPPNKPDDPGFARTFIQPSTLPTLTPYFLDPDKIDLSKTDYVQTHAAQLNVKTLLVDPYAPIHCYSSILPIKSHQVPAWTLGEPMRNMTAFFSMGPILLTKDVPKTFTSAKEATPTSWLDSQGTDTSNLPDDVKMAVAGTKG
jgi:hypothetical protein